MHPSNQDGVFQPVAAAGGAGPGRGRSVGLPAAGRVASTGFVMKVHSGRGLRRVAHVMGTPVSLHLADPLPAAALERLADKVFAWLREVDARFSTYRADSEVNRLDRGYVKGWAVQRASDRLVEAGAVNHFINAGCDVRVRGRPAPERPDGHPLRDHRGRPGFPLRRSAARQFLRGGLNPQTGGRGGRRRPPAL